MENEHKEGMSPEMKKEHDDDKLNSGMPVISENTVWFTLAGLLIGGATGWFLGTMFGQGAFAIPGLNMLAAGDRAVSGFLFASFFGSLFGLTGALIATLSSKKAGAEKTNKKLEQSNFYQNMPVYGSLALVVFFSLTLYVIATTALGVGGEASDQSSRLTWNLKNSVRVGGQTDAETYPAALQIAFPSTRTENSPRSVFVAPNDWRNALAATPLIAHPNYAAIVVAGENVPPNFGTAAPTDLQGDFSQIAAQVDDRLAQTNGGAFSTNVMIVSADADFRFAAPAAAYSARTGTPIFFVTKDGVPDATGAALQKRNGQSNIFVLGSGNAVSENVFEGLKQFGTVTRIGGGDFHEAAVKFAEFRNEAADFGWGRTGRYARRFTPTNVILLNPTRWQDAIAAAHLAARGKTGPILYTEKDRLPPIVENFLWRNRPFFAVTPAEGAFNHLWVVGSSDHISYKTQAWADYSQEIEQYMTYGDSAVSGYEAMGIGWMILSIACAIWILVHSVKKMPDMMPTIKAAWTIFALLLGPLAIFFYILCYHRRPKIKHDGMTMWQRPMWLKAVSATVMMFAFDMMLMCLAVFFLAYAWGFPIIQFNTSLYWLGSSMFLMMAFMYFFALIVMMLVFHTPMTMREKKIDSYWKAFMVGFPIMLITMTIESAGMMPTMWWQQMIFLPAMQMPTDDDFTMWSTLLFAVFIGFLVVYPFNYWMVVKGKKVGGM